ncbi:hypothetical protein [Agrobacterium rosae]|uniref:hypothetical protein n=1 Tax=Agrobacterium rosae TaxID=1972867 RepID=UPI001177DB4D|nr:hypothetical protein [Agrobacterium rosae]
MRVPDPTLVDKRLRVEVEFELEEYGRWIGDLSLFIYSQEDLQAERAKARWMVENMRRAENGQRVLPSLTPPVGWCVDDGFPD